jgi:hypothetical protein
MTVEAVNTVVIVMSNDPLDIVMNFMALVVISEFGSYFYDAYQSNASWKDVITDEPYANMLVIQTTTSYQARHLIDGNKIELQECEETMKSDSELANKIEDFKIPTHIKISFWKDRSCMNKFLYIVYKVIRCFYVSMWFYFLPFVVVFASYLIPSTGGD